MFNFNKNFRKIRKNVKAISPVISVLLMIAVAVVASLVAYAWVMGYMNFQTAKTGQAIQIQSVSNSTVGSPQISVYVQNVGEGSIKLTTGQCLYINGTLIAAAGPVGGLDSNGNLGQGSTTQIDADVTSVHSGDVFNIKVATAGGTFSEVTKIFP